MKDWTSLKLELTGLAFFCSILGSGSSKRRPCCKSIRVSSTSKYIPSWPISSKNWFYVFRKAFNSIISRSQMSLLLTFLYFPLIFAIRTLDHCKICLIILPLKNEFPTSSGSAFWTFTFFNLGYFMTILCCNVRAPLRYGTSFDHLNRFFPLKIIRNLIILQVQLILTRIFGYLHPKINFLCVCYWIVVLVQNQLHNLCYRTFSHKS